MSADKGQGSPKENNQELNTAAIVNEGAAPEDIPTPTVQDEKPNELPAQIVAAADGHSAQDTLVVDQRVEEPTISHTVEDTFILDRDAYTGKIGEEEEPCLDTLKSSLRKSSRDKREKISHQNEPMIPKKSTAKSIFREYSEVTKLNTSMT